MPGKVVSSLRRYSAAKRRLGARGLGDLFEARKSSKGRAAIGPLGWALYSMYPPLM